MNLLIGKEFLERKPQLKPKKFKYRIDHYDHFFKPSHAFKGSFFFETLEEAEKFMKGHEEALKSWPSIFDNDEYVLIEIESGSVVRTV